MPSFTLRSARTSDVAGIRLLVRPLADQRVLLEKEAVAYFESLQEFIVAEDGGDLLGCGALHVMWEDLAEIRTLATNESARGQGIGKALLRELVDRARVIGVKRLFCLTFEVDFFRAMGFEVMEIQSAVDPEVYSELLRSTDEGVAEFLDLARVKPNTLGNTRMIMTL
jgi:N-acetylglutamate synthase and related acetyltransferases